MLYYYRNILFQPQPTLDIDFIALNSIPSFITFSRSSGATRIKSDKLLESVGVNVARFGYDVSTGTKLGIIVEPSTTNRILYSRDLTNSQWLKRSSTAARCDGIDGVVNSASTLTSTDTNAFCTRPIASGTTLSNRITSAYVKRRTGTGDVFLSHGETTGSELFPDPGFTSGITGWTASNGAIVTHDNGTLKIEENGTLANPQVVYNASSLVQQGKVYKFTANLTASTSSGALRQFAGSSSGSNAYGGSSFLNTIGEVSICFAPNKTSTYLTIQNETTAGGTSSINVDNISLKEVVETQLSLTDSWKEVKTNYSNISVPTVNIRMAATSNAIDIDYIMHELGTFNTSPVATTSATVDRSADVMTMNLTERSDILIQDRGGAYWVNNQAQGTFTITPRTGQCYISRMRIFKSGVVSDSQKELLGVAY